MRRRGLSNAGVFELCGSVQESVNHLFIHCRVASSIWSHFVKAGMVGVSEVAAKLVELGWKTFSLDVGSSFGGLLLSPYYGQFGRKEIIEFSETSCPLSWSSSC